MKLNNDYFTKAWLMAGKVKKEGQVEMVEDMYEGYALSEELPRKGKVPWGERF